MDREHDNFTAGSEDQGAKLETHGLDLTLNTVLDIITRVASAAELAMPGFKTLLDAVKSTFNSEANARIEDAYAAVRAKSDRDHEDLQNEAEAGGPDITG